MIRRPPRSTLSSSSAASDVYKRQVADRVCDRKWSLTSNSLSSPLHHISIVVSRPGGVSHGERVGRRHLLIAGSDRTLPSWRRRGWAPSRAAPAALSVHRLPGLLQAWLVLLLLLLLRRRLGLALFYSATDKQVSAPSAEGCSIYTVRRYSAYIVLACEADVVIT